MFKFLLTGCVEIICKVSLQNLFNPFPYVIKKLNLPKSYNCKWVRAKIVTGKSTQNSEYKNPIFDLKGGLWVFRKFQQPQTNFLSYAKKIKEEGVKLTPPLPSRNRVNCLLETVLSVFRFSQKYV